MAEQMLTLADVRDEFERLYRSNPVVYRAMHLFQRGDCSCEDALKMAVVHLATTNAELMRAEVRRLAETPPCAAHRSDKPTDEAGMQACKCGVSGPATEMPLAWTLEGTETVRQHLQLVARITFHRRVLCRNCSGLVRMDYCQSYAAPQNA